MIRRIVLAVIVAVVVGLVCLLVGSLLASLSVPPLAVIGGFLVEFCWLLGVLAGIWHFFGGSLSL